MTEPPPDPEARLEHVIDAISDGDPVEWDRELAGPEADLEALETLRLIDQIARVHRGGTPPPAEEIPEKEWSWGPLVVRSRLGGGIYGQVHRAFDAGLRREVALKLWSRSVRPRVITRLFEEARALARVRHPNVLLVFGADVHDGRAGMWTELLEGATLEELLARDGGMHWREAAILGIDLCRALAAVHAAGFVHRDVKASNIMRERGGRIVLLDFGSAGYSSGRGDDPAAGVQGSPLAMAPEVMRGEPATPAADLYSLGVLLFRVVAGRYPIEVETLEELRAALEHGPPASLRRLRPETPLAFTQVVERALARSPAERCASAADMERMLVEALRSDWDSAPASAATSATPTIAPYPQKSRRWAGWAAGAVLVVTAVAYAAFGRWHRAPASDPPRPMQFTMPLPLGQHLPQFANVVVSPDGATIAFASQDSTGTSALWLRRFDSRGSWRIPGTEGAIYPFWSPDSRNLGFFSRGRLMRVGAEGGPVRTICPAELARGGTWNTAGVIVFAGSTIGPLQRVPASGGTPMPVSVIDSSGSEISHRWPCFLPDGEHFLFVSTPARNGTYSLFVGSLRSDRRVYVGEAESGVVYSSGVLVYVEHHTLQARPFNVGSLRWQGEPMPISDIPGLGGSLAEPHVSVSRNGTLVSSSLTVHSRRLEWVDAATGAVTPLASGPYFSPSLSPDGRRVAAERAEGTGHSNIWMLDAKSGAAERWTNAAALNRAPIWSPDGDSLLFSSNRDGRYAIYQRSTNGALAEHVRYAPANTLLLWPSDWRAGGLIAFDRFEPGTAYNVYVMRDGVANPLARTPAFEERAALSPDERWLAYDSDATGRARIYVVDLRTSETYLLPGEGGLEARWTRGTGRLFYRTPAGVFFEVAPQPGRAPNEWPARRLRRIAAVESYDVDAQGRRFLCCAVSESGRPEEILVLVNMPQALAHALP